MTLNANELAEIEAVLAAPDADTGVLGELRRRFPQISLTRCDASDVGVEPPFREFQRFSLYLVDGADHCWRLTNDTARATGIVVVPHKVTA
jgi:Family of unknown function (DUF6129)